MDNIINKYIDNSVYRKLRESSKIAYRSKLKSLYKLLNLKHTHSILKKIKKPPEMIKNITDNSISHSMIRNFLNLCVILLDAFMHDMEKYNSLHEQYIEAVKKYDKNNSQQKNKKEKIKMSKENGKLITLHTLKQVAKKWRDKYTNDPTKKNLFFLLISLLYTNITDCVRRNIFYTVKIINDESENDGVDNYFVSGKNSCFILNNSKTSGKKGSKIIKIYKNSLLYKTISESIRINKQHYLLISPYNNKPVSSSAQMTQMVNKTFKSIHPSISSTIIRKIFLSNLMKDDLRLERKSKIASNFGHSVSTLETYYVKHDN
jgi:hypothetical protein